MALAWDESLSVGVPELDEQHQEIVARLRAILHAVHAGHRAAAAIELKMLHTVLAAHFDDEKRWMESCGYPHRAEHNRAHEIGLASFHKAILAYEQGGPSSRFVELVERSASWLDIHLRAGDLRVGIFQRTRRRAAGTSGS